MEECQRCHEIDEDRRTLYMACFYEMNELDIPFYHDKTEPKLYSLRVCKRCRSEWMQAIQSWFHDVRPEQSCDSGIFVRTFGHTHEITPEEFA